MSHRSRVTTCPAVCGVMLSRSDATAEELMAEAINLGWTIAGGQYCPAHQCTEVGDIDDAES